MKGIYLTKEEHILVRDTLLYYANPETYFAIGIFPDSPCGDFINDFDETELGLKPGKQARNCLDILSKNKENK